MTDDNRTSQLPSSWEICQKHGRFPKGAWCIICDIERRWGNPTAMRHSIPALEELGQPRCMKHGNVFDASAGCWQCDQIIKQITDRSPWYQAWEKKHFSELPDAVDTSENWEQPNAVT